ncbi:MAG: VRR-NUC domain-containing protein [Gammaproteobacteria bacterium]|nr:VRR-NUC domain-containing protein [Gammaproteobacteria bacterium]
MVEELPQGYYLDNFHYLLEFVSRQYAHLLTKDEIAYAADFNGLPVQARMLYVRLVQRKGPLFRCDKICYEEITDLQQAIEQLAEAGFLDDAHDAEVPEVLRLLTKKELLDLPEAAEFDSSQKKNVTLDNLIDVKVVITAFSIVRPLLQEFLQLYKLLFFGNLTQDFTEFVLNDLGVTPFEKYPLQPDASFFESRWLIEETRQLYALNELSHDIVIESDPTAMAEFVQLLPERYDNVRLGRRHDRIVNRIARQYERLGALDDAMLLYAGTLSPPSRERRARILQKENRLEECIEQCIDMLQNPASDQELEVATRFLHRFRKKELLSQLVPDFDMEILEFKPALHRVCTKNISGKRVEEVACDWFEHQGFEAYYVENSLLPGLFGLAFWDIIFAPVKSAFFNPFQRGPADMFSPEFYGRRRELIESRLLELGNREYLRNLVLTHFDEKYPVANHFVHWSMLTKELLERFLSVISINSLLSVFKRLLADPRNNRSGFPDLVVFQNGGYRLVEVKGPGDRLQENQLRWLRHFSSVGIPAEVVHISWK